MLYASFLKVTLQSLSADMSRRNEGTKTHKLKCVSLGEVFWWEGKDRLIRGKERWERLPICGWELGAVDEGGDRDAVCRREGSQHWLWIVKLSLTRTMKRGTFDTLRSYGQLAENASWQRQLWEHSAKQTARVALEGRESASRSLAGIGGCAYWLFQLVLEKWTKAEQRQPDVILSFQKQRASIIP